MHTRTHLRILKKIYTNGAEEYPQRNKVAFFRNEHTHTNVYLSFLAFFLVKNIYTPFLLIFTRQKTSVDLFMDL